MDHVQKTQYAINEKYLISGKNTKTKIQTEPTSSENGQKWGAWENLTAQSGCLYGCRMRDGMTGSLCRPPSWFSGSYTTKLPVSRDSDDNCPRV
jgi:hypothetical protein